jgi:hypothetical protein
VFFVYPKVYNISLLFGFRNLFRLQHLDLSSNYLRMKDLPPGVFSPVGALQSLRLQGNDDGRVGEYPLNVFSALTALETVSIDSFRE